MIKKERIDLTQDRTFTEPRRNKLLEDIHRIPWNVRPVENIGEGRYNRPWGDPISDDMQMLVRRCSDGKWFFGETITKWYFDNMFNELLWESGIRDNPAIFICPRCGVGRITTNRWDICPKCKLEEHDRKIREHLFKKEKRPDNYIPWLDYNVIRSNNEFHIQTIGFN